MKIHEIMFYWYVQTTFRFLAKILFRFQTRGSENVPRKGAFILASNHRSNLDPPILASAISRKLHFMAKVELFDNKIFVAVLKRLNCIKLNRQGMDRSALKQGLQALHNGRGLLVFPEGRRSADGGLSSGKAGAALFAFGANVPVIPVFIRGTERAMPPKRHFISPVKVRITLGKKIFPARIVNRQDKKAAYQEFTDRIMKEIAGLEKEAA